MKDFFADQGSGFCGGGGSGTLRGLRGGGQDESADCIIVGTAAVETAASSSASRSSSCVEGTTVVVGPDATTSGTQIKRPIRNQRPPNLEKPPPQEAGSFPPNLGSGVFSQSQIRLLKQGDVPSARESCYLQGPPLGSRLRDWAGSGTGAPGGAHLFAAPTSSRIPLNNIARRSPRKEEEEGDPPQEESLRQMKGRNSWDVPFPAGSYDVLLFSKQHGFFNNTNRGICTDVEKGFKFLKVFFTRGIFEEKWNYVPGDPVPPILLIKLRSSSEGEKINPSPSSSSSTETFSSTEGRIRCAAAPVFNLAPDCDSSSRHDDIRTDIQTFSHSSISSINNSTLITTATTPMMSQAEFDAFLQDMRDSFSDTFLQTLLQHLCCIKLLWPFFLLATLYFFFTQQISMAELVGSFFLLITVVASGFVAFFVRRSGVKKEDLDTKAYELSRRHGFHKKNMRLVVQQDGIFIHIVTVVACT